VAIQLLPLTVTSLILLGLGNLYTNYVETAGVATDPREYVGIAASYFAQHNDAMLLVMLWLGVIFAICLAANTLLLVLFARLIRPIVSRSVARKRPVAQGIQTEFEVQENGEWMLKSAAEMHRFLTKRRVVTKRPPEMVPIEITVFT
jgi:hypothetical protein